MRICTVKLSSATAYSQSKALDEEEFPLLPKESRDDYDRRMWREKASYDEKGIVFIPEMALKMAVDEAVKRLNIGIPGRGKSTYTKFFVAGQICSGNPSLGIHKDDLKPVTIWANADGVRGSGKRVKRRFPYIPSWETTAQFYLLDDVIPKEVFEKALKESGQLIGIGRFRPEKGGTLGRYMVSDFSWQEL